MTRALLASLTAVVVATGLSCKKNRPPDVPAVPTGPTTCFQDTAYTFTTTATDPEGDSVSVHFLWTEAWPSNWSDWIRSGDTVSMTHVWYDADTFEVRAEARDRQDRSSGWSDPLTVVVVRRWPPNTPNAPTGPSTGGQDSTYTFAVVAFHPDSITVALRFYWEDGDTSNWSAFVASGESVFMSHAWSVPDSYQVKAQAKDTGAALSKWSPAHLIVIRPPDTLSKWRFRLDAAGEISLVSSPAVGADGTVYVGSSDSCLYAVNPDGTLKWRYRTGGYVQSSPAIGPDGTVYFGSNDRYLYALDPDSSFQWKYLTGSSVTSSPAIASDGTIYVGSNDGRVYAVNPDGSPGWDYPTGDDVRSSPAVAADGIIYVGSYDSCFHAINQNGTMKWRLKTSRRLLASPAIGPDGTVYFGSDDNNLRALNPDSTLKWIYSTGGDVRSSPAIAADGTIYVGSDDDYLYALDPGGSRKWATPVGGNADDAPVLAADGTIYVTSDNSYIYALNSDGTVKWHYKADGIIESSPTIGPDGTVYFTSNDGYLYALKGSSPLADSPWPKFHHDLANTGRVGGGR